MLELAKWNWSPAAMYVFGDVALHLGPLLSQKWNPLHSTTFSPRLQQGQAPTNHSFKSKEETPAFQNKIGEMLPSCTT